MLAQLSCIPLQILGTVAGLEWWWEYSAEEHKRLSLLQFSGDRAITSGVDAPSRNHTSVWCELKDVKLPRWLRLNWQKLAARSLLPLVSFLLLCLSRVIKFSISFSFSCSSFKKKSTSTLFSFLICSLISLGMSGIIQSTSTLRNITRFCKRNKLNKQEEDVFLTALKRSLKHSFWGGIARGVALSTSVWGACAHTPQAWTERANPALAALTRWAGTRHSRHGECSII